MKSIISLLLCLLVVSFAGAQQTQGTSAPLTVVSTVPANGTMNVSAGTTTVSLTFSDPIDTTVFARQNDGSATGFFTSLDTVAAITYSADHRTANLQVRLSAGKPYFVSLIYAKSAAAVQLSAPYVFYFTTGASFPAFSVSGSVLSGSSGVSTAGSLVVLSYTSVSQANPVFAMGAIADGAGNFTVPYVSNGTLYPIAAKDLTNDGQIDPNSGDAVGTAPAIVMNSANITGLTITFQSVLPFTYKDALDSLAAHVGTFSAPRTLKMVQASGIDSTGKASYWEFDYTGIDLAHSFTFDVETFGVRVRTMDAGQYSWVVQTKPIGALPTVAAVDTFLARAERQGGKAYRPVPMTWNGFDVRLSLGDIMIVGFNDMISDTSKFYLGLTYWYGTQGQNQQITYGQRRFVADYTTGSILGTTGVSPAGEKGLPARYSLEQNYPNPFNPATNVEFNLPATSQVQLRVYNMLGQEVATLVNGTVVAGHHAVSFDGSHLASGIYLYRLVAGTYVSTMKMVLLK
jgi:hypothetical protein